MRLESLPKINFLVQSDTTRNLVRQLTCLLGTKTEEFRSSIELQLNCVNKLKISDEKQQLNHLAYTEYQSH